MGGDPMVHQTAANFPPQTTPFVGRQTELAEIDALLQNPACRLLTLVGPGGVGKTRLALECAGKLADLLPNGRFFIDLQAIQSADLLATAVADALHLHLQPNQPILQQLAHTLSQKSALLLLDNMEHLLDGAPLLADLLFAAPALKLLVTSREALNLEAEWLYPLAGMAYPDSHLADDLETYSAVAFFAQRARRLRPDFALNAESEGVVRICQQVEGLPLALDLAAAWVKTLRCADIAAEIQHNLDFLATRLRQSPAPHRSMRAVFDHSWRLLPETEQTLFCRLAVFHGGFTREAAAAVAGATLDDLTALVDKSLLRWEDNGRYHLHALLRQFALEQLSAAPGALASARQRHCDYFADRLRVAETGLIGGAQMETLDSLQSDLDNIRAAWRCAIERQDAAALRKMGHSLSNYFQFRGRYQEPAEAIEAGLAVLEQTAVSPQRDLTLCFFHLELAWLNIRFGRISKAAYHAAQAQSYLEQCGSPPPPGIATDPRLAFGLLAAIRGDYPEAQRQYAQAYAQSAQQGHRCNQHYACHGLANAALELGDLETAVRYAREGLALCVSQEEFWLRAYLLNQLGSIALRQGNLAAAKSYYEESYAVRARFNDPEGMALALNYLGEIHVQQGEMPAAADCFQRSLALYREIDDRGGLATALAGLGQTAVRQQQFDEARQYLAQALAIAAEIGYMALLRGLRPWIERLLRQLGVAPAALLVEVEAGEEGAITAVVAQLQTPITPSPTLESPPVHPNDALVEPLTEREIEVLQAIAQGLTNQQIADTFILSLGTVKWYTGQIYGKLGVTSRTQAIARARELGFL
jgi:predicted ATPase/DNA-binding CsgD family transcriptional regulator